MQLSQVVPHDTTRILREQALKANKITHITIVSPLVHVMHSTSRAKHYKNKHPYLTHHLLIQT